MTPRVDPETFRVRVHFRSSSRSGETEAQVRDGHTAEVVVRIASR